MSVQHFKYSSSRARLSSASVETVRDHASHLRSAENPDLPSRQSNQTPSQQSANDRSLLNRAHRRFGTGTSHLLNRRTKSNWRGAIPCSFVRPSSSDVLNAAFFSSLPYERVARAVRIAARIFTSRNRDGLLISFRIVSSRGRSRSKPVHRHASQFARGSRS